MTRYTRLALGCGLSLIVSLAATGTRAETDIWTTGASTFWTAGPWSLGHPPFSTDSAVFNQPASYSASFDGGDATINDLSITAGNVTFNVLSGPAHTLHLNGTGGFNRFSVNGGTLNLNNVGLNAAGRGDISNGGTLNVNSGPLVTGSYLDIASASGIGSLLVVGSGSSATASDQSFWGLNGGQADVTFSFGATGTFGTVDMALSSHSGTTANVNVITGADLNTGSLSLATSGGTTTAATLNLQHAGSTVTQSGASQLTVGHSATGTAAINIGTTASGGTLTTGTGLMTINKTGTVTLGSGANTGTLNANGNVTIDGGVLSRNNNGSHFNLAAGKTMTIQNGGRASFTGDYTTANAIYNITGGSSKMEAVGGSLIITNGGQVNVSNGGLLAAGDRIDIGVGGFIGTLTVDGSGSSVTSPGTNLWGGDGGTASVTFSNGAMGTFDGADLANDGTSGTSATLNVQSGASVSFSNLVLAPVPFAGVSATMNINGTGSLVSQTGASVLTVGNGFTSPANINIGTTASGGTLTTGTGIVSINKTGTVTVGGTTTTGSLIANGNVNISAGVLQVNSGSGVLVASGKTMTLFNAGTLKGSGNVFGNVVNSGVVAPGLSPGTLPINGNYTQNSAGVLQIELSSAVSFDRLLVSGAATLGGTLVVSLIDGFVPAPGNSFDILDWATRSGTFATPPQLPALTGGLQWNTSQLYTNGVVSVGIPGDFNLNGKVDAADYVLWRKSPGTYGGSPTGYNTWRTNFGQPPGSGSGTSLSAAVPEPATLVPLMFAAAGIRLRRRNCA